MAIGLDGNRMSGGMKKSKLIFAMVALAGLTACTTVEGIGRDISRGAQAVDRAL